MSAIVVLPIAIPAAMALWPIVATAAAAAAASLGFAAAQESKDGIVEETETGATVPIENAEAFAGEVAPTQQLVFQDGDIRVTVGADAHGRIAVHAGGRGHTEAELEAVARRMATQLQQQYAYHRLVTELKERDFNIVDQEVDEDGTVRMHVRVYHQ